MTKEEWEKVNQMIKSVQYGKKAVVRSMINRNMDFADVQTVLAAFGGVSDNNSPVDTEKGQKKPVNGTTNEIQGKDESQDENNQLERVKDAGEMDLSDIYIKIESALSDYAISQGLDSKTDLIKASQRIWGGASAYIGNNVIKPSKITRDLSKPFAYDINRVADLTRLYFNLCDNYNKAVLIEYIAYFLGVSDEYIYENTEKLTLLGVDVYKKRELSLASGIIDSKTNVTGSLAALNHWHGWSGAGSTHTERREMIVMYPALNMHQSNSTPQIATNETKQVL